MKILLSYSYHHFDPDKPLESQPERNSSAGILARTFYEALSELGDVTYTDASRYTEHLGRDFDLFVGIASHFHDIIKANLITVRKSIFVAVNMHPLERNKILNKAINELKLPEEAVCKDDIVDPAPYIEALELADHIMCVGNVDTYNSYIKHGIPKAKIKLFNYGLLTEAVKQPKPADNIRKYVYIASEVGLRKGFDVLYDILMSESLEKERFQIDIIGPTTTQYHANKIEELKTRLGKKFIYHGRLNSSSREYKNLITNSDFLLFPSLEEGQAGTVLDSLARGVVPILSKNTGVDFSPLGYLEFSGNKFNDHNLEIFRKSLSISKDELIDLKQKSLEYYAEFHQDFKAPILEMLRKAVQDDTLYPRISLILAIYNKEPTIIDLLENLNKSIGQYPEAELHVIFDGCTDKTEKLVRYYFENTIVTYETTFTVTPNLFEIKTNNLGLRKSTGKYGVIIQDDNYIYDDTFLFEAVNFLDKDAKAVVLGGLAGVNFYPRGTTGLRGKGQITMNEDEVYWRQDANTDPRLKDRIYQVDACMRGPLIIRKSFLEETGYLDEVYVPLYEDDMDLGLRAQSWGYKVYCMLMKVENKSLSMAHADPEKSKMFNDTIKRNTDIFYKRWKPSTTKDYTWINRTRIYSPKPRLVHDLPVETEPVQKKLLQSLLRSSK